MPLIVHDTVPKSIDLNVAVGDDDDVGVVQQVQDPPRILQSEANITLLPWVQNGPPRCRGHFRGIAGASSLMP